MIRHSGLDMCRHLGEQGQLIEGAAEIRIQRHDIDARDAELAQQIEIGWVGTTNIQVLEYADSLRAGQ
jgi:hypothetical protein